MRVSEAIALYLRDREPEVSALTLRNVRQTLTRLADKHGNAELAELDAATLRTWRNGLGVSPTSAEKYLDRVRAFLNYARKEGWMDVTPTVGRLHVPTKRQLRIDIDQIASLIDQPRTWRDKGAVAMSIEFLMRASEIAEIRVGNIRLRDYEADLPVMKARGEFAWDEGVPIGNELHDLLDSWLYRYEKAVGPLQDDWYLFPSQENLYAGKAGRKVVLHPTEPMAHPYLIMHRALNAIGVAVGRRGFHAVRRSMARIRYDALVAQKESDPVGVIAALLHHESRRTTELYLGVKGDRERRNALMRAPEWVSPLARAKSDKVDGSDLAKVIRLRP